jgi:class 3 adenylate cyclase
LGLDEGIPEELMAWNEARSRQRIKQHQNTVPEFDEKITLAKHTVLMAEDRKKGLMDTMTTRRAFAVDGAHVYGRLLDFDSVVADSQGNETEHSHRELLQFLDLYYRLWDEIVEADASDRVDYHGARMHAVVTQPEDDPAGQVERAYSLAVHLTDASRRIAGAAGFSARIRFGIDQGKCLAMTTGRSHEKDTLFLGSPANHAAKKVAEGDEEGIFFVDGLRDHLSKSFVTAVTGNIQLNAQSARRAIETYQFPRLENATARLMAEATKRRSFQFFRPSPPLADLKFSDLAPSKTARMEMASLFADIDGFTSFVDNAIRKGSNSIKAAATAIHVIREELNDVLNEDFGGKRVRFIGDCIHGVIGAGARYDDSTEAVRQAALCASGMQSSFELCQKVLGNLNDIGLAIGIEYGPTPLTRLGQSGDESVRCAASCAVVVSERTQQDIEGSGVKLGPKAAAHADAQVRKYYREAAAIMGFDAAADLLGSMASPAVATVREDRTARPYFNKAIR